MTESNLDEYTKMWKEMWSSQKTGWHMTVRNPTLIKYGSKLLEGRKSGKMTLLFPFCGKAVDMKAYYDEGHTVFGIDCSLEPIMDFFKEHALEYDQVLMSNGKDYYYTTKDRRLTILNTNFYTLDDEMINRKIDSVWDRGGFVAVDGVEQEMYIKTIRRLLADEFRYLLLVVEYDQSRWQSIPFPQPEEKVRKFYDWAKVEKLEAWTVNEKRYQNLKDFATLEVKEVVYLITPKSG